MKLIGLEESAKLVEATEDTNKLIEWALDNQTAFMRAFVRVEATYEEKNPLMAGFGEKELARNIEDLHIRFQFCMSKIFAGAYDYYLKVGQIRWKKY